ncbi:50S ribosomal protein L1, partial [Lachnellula suecica]
MATARPCLAQLSRSCLQYTRSTPAHQPTRLFTSTAFLGKKYVEKIVSKKDKSASGGAKPSFVKKTVAKKKKKASTTYKQYDLRNEETFSLLDAMHIIRAWEVGQKPTSVKYELALKLKSLKNGPVVRNRLRLPHPVKTDIRVCVICPPDSKYAEAAKAAGAVFVGEEDVFEAVKAGKIEFDRCLCQTDSLAKLNKSGIARILGPRGLMPSSKL